MTTPPPMMKCGHAANSILTLPDGTKIPACVICAGIDPGAAVIDDTPPSFEGRTARCSYGPHHDVPSSSALAFFSHRPDRQYDDYYCGCKGWD